MIADKFRQITDMFANYLDEESEKISRDFRYVIARTYNIARNGKEGYGINCLGIDVFFRDIEGDSSDSLALQLCIEERPGFQMNVTLTWGFPIGETAAWMFPENIEFNDDNLELVECKLPYMIKALRQTIEDNPHGKTMPN